MELLGGGHCGPKRMQNEFSFEWRKGADEMRKKFMKHEARQQSGNGIQFVCFLCGGLWAVAPPMAPPQRENSKTN